MTPDTFPIFAASAATYCAGMTFLAIRRPGTACIIAALTIAAILLKGLPA